MMTGFILKHHIVKSNVFRQKDFRKCYTRGQTLATNSSGSAAQSRCTGTHRHQGPSPRQMAQPHVTVGTGVSSPAWPFREEPQAAGWKLWPEYKRWLEQHGPAVPWGTRPGRWPQPSPTALVSHRWPDLARLRCRQEQNKTKHFCACSHCCLMRLFFFSRPAHDKPREITSGTLTC